MSRSRAFERGPRLVAAVAMAVCAPLAVGEDHKTYADMKPGECQECHRGAGVIDNHGATFQREHRLLAQKASNNCADCHQQSFCADCHAGGGLQRGPEQSLSRRGEYMPGTHRSDFISIHAIKAADDPRSCERCHDSRKFCSDCHERQIGRNRAGMSIKPHRPAFVAPGVPDPAWVSAHSQEARRSLQSCQTCHPRKQDCSNFACHPSLGGR